MSTALVPFETLCQITGYRRAGEVARHLRKVGIAFFLGKGGAPWTTVDLINAAGGVVPGTAANDVDAPYPVALACVVRDSR